VGLPHGRDDPRPGLVPLPQHRSPQVQPVHAAHDAHGGSLGRPHQVRRYGIRPPYCLFVGNLEPRKNLTRLVDAFARIRAHRGGAGPQLVVAGTRGWLYGGIFRAVEAHEVARDIVFTGYVPPADLPALYAGAACFVFPSLYEGFGLPVLEAMAAGAPVVASRAGAIPEVAGEAALLVDAERPERIAEAVESVLDDPALRARMTARGRARAREFTWEAVARRTLAVYEAVYATRGDAGPGGGHRAGGGPASAGRGRGAPGGGAS
jgi:glycosyltransferase involved in cell wall biosynthesis